MNRIFRRVWNSGLHQWVVASELASGHRPPGMASHLSGISGTAPMPRFPLAALCLALSSAPLLAQEFTVTDGSAPVVVGDGGTVSFAGDGNVSVTQTGSHNDARFEIALQPDLVGDSVTTGATRVDTNGVRVGSNVALGATGLTLGANAPSITTAGINSGNRVISGVAAGTAADHAVNFAQFETLQNQAGAGWNVAVGANTYNIAPTGRVTFSGDSNLTVALTGADDAAGVAYALNPNLAVTSVATGTTVMSGTGVQVGSAVQLTATGLAITSGPSVTTTGIHAGNRVITNLADGAITASSTEAISGRQIYELLIDEGAEGVRYFHANSVQVDSRAIGAESVAIGPRTVADGVSSLAAGDSAVTTDGAEAAIAIGQRASVGTAAAVTPDGVAAIAIGRDALAVGNGTIALGDGARVDSEYVSNAVALGTGARVSGIGATNATAIGFQASAGAGGATALGANASANGGGSIAIGRASANGDNALAAGTGAQAASPNGIALGAGAGVGTNGTEAGDRTSHIAIGTGAGTSVVGNQTTAIGYQAGTGVVGDQNIAIGSQAGAGVTGDFNVAIGYRANRGAGEVDRATALGAQASAGSDSAAFGFNARTTGVSAVAMGAEASASGQGVAVGRSAYAEGGNTALGFNARAITADAAGTGFLTGSSFDGGTVVSVGSTASNLHRRIVNVADGAQGHDAVNVNQLRSAQTATANLVGGNVVVNPNGSYGGYVIELEDTGGQIHRYTTVAQAINAVSSGQISVLPGDAVIRNPDDTISTGTATLGGHAVNLEQLNAAIDANSTRYVSINSTDPANRDNSGASGQNAIAIGPQADADGEAGLSVGYQARSIGNAATALGNDVAALGHRSTAIGSLSQAYDDGTVAIGDRAVANGLNSVVIGTNAQADRKTSDDSVDNAVVIGTDAEVTADNGIAVGHSALASEVNAVAQGFDAHATATSAVATGTRARASGVNALASGTDASASGTNAIATGTDSRGLAADGIAIGTRAVSGFSPLPGEETSNVNTIAIGNGANAVYQDATAIGRAAQASELAAAAFGDAADASAEAALALGRGATASGVSSIAQGDGAVADAEAALASGRGASAGGMSSIAQGDGAIASAANAAAIGRQAQATQVSAVALGDDARATGIDAIAAGRGARAGQSAASAFGADAQATQANASAFGANARATVAGATASGQDARATASGALALGQGSRAGNANAVALGQGATTAAAVATPNAVIDHVTYAYAGTSPIATVSVGTDTQKRTITNVAAGRVTATSTDAINGSQLFRTNEAVTALGNNLDTVGQTIAGSLGGGSTYNPATHTVAAQFTVGSNSYTTVQSALQAASAGWSVTAQGANGSTVGIDSETGNAMDLRNADGNLVVGKITGSNTVTFDLADDITVDSVTAGDSVLDTNGLAVDDGAGNSTTVGAGTVVVTDPTGTTTIGGSTISAGGSNPILIDGNAGVIGGLTNTTFDPGATYTGGVAATQEQLSQVNGGLIAAGLDFVGDDGQVIHRDLGEQLSITGGATGMLSEGNISVTRNAAGDGLVVELADNIALTEDGSLAIGDGTDGSTLDAGGLAVVDGDRATTVGAGTVAVTDPTGTTTIGGSTISVGGSNPILIDGNAGVIGGLTNTTFDPGATYTGGVAATQEQLSQVNGGLIAAGLDFVGDDGQVVHRDLGEQLSVTGGVTGALSEGNIGVTRNAAGDGLVVELADNIALTEDGSLVIGDGTDGSTLDAGGLAVVDGDRATTVGAGTVAVTDPTGTTTIGGNAISVGGANPVLISGDSGTIGGLTNRTWDPDAFTSGQAATEDQLKLVSDAANAGWNVTDADGNTATIGPNGQVTFTGDQNLGVAQTGVDDAGVVAITLNRDLVLDSVTIGDAMLDTDGLVVDDGAGNRTQVGAGTVAVIDPTGTTTIGGSTISVGGNNPILIDGNAGVIGGLQNQTIDYPGFADGSGRSATEEQLALVNETANAGWNVTAQGQNGSNVAVNSATGNTVDLNNADGNIVVTKSATSNDVTFDLADEIEVDSLTAGDTAIDTTGVAIGPDVKLGNTGLVIDGGPSVTLTGIDAGGLVISGVADGVALTDAVNVGQLQDTVETNRTKYYSVNSTSGGNFDNDGATGADAIAAGKDAEAEGAEAVALGLAASAAGAGGVAIGAGAQALSLNSLAIGAGAVSSHANSIALGAGSATTIGAQANYQGAYVGDSSSSGELNIGGRQITGVAAGSAATDAVNVSQLQGGVNHAISESNSYTDGQISNVNNRIDAIDGRVTTIEGDIVDIRGDITDIQGDIVDIRGDITDLGDRMTNVEGVVVEVDNRITRLENGGSGPFQVTQGETYVAPTPTGQNASAGGNGAVASGNNSVAIGNQSTASGAGSTAVGQGATASAANSTALGQGATASHGNSVALGAGSATTVGAQANYNAAYVGSSTSTGEVNVGGRTITGVAPGIAGTDAVNVNQLGAGVSHAINAANQYTDGRIAQIQDDMWTIDRGYRGATASAMAMAGLPQAYLPGKSMLAVGFGGYQSEYGMAVGLSGITDNGRWVYKAQASGNTAREWGFSVGAGIQW